eukprot:TRINITY_DN3556_c0_g1_i1.p1 TRINITY_DN3556_c0_g1~~TRINITY_DN3556_c0_g1_i1.p1  ORF type:complete len:438 (-),score=104.26 TRINITY_DN3556_c0_g1_i1:221-1534(-)
MNRFSGLTVVGLSMEEPHCITVPRHPDDASEEQVVISVTLLPANHCPGSCMFRFEGTFGRYLYTGDFRNVPGLPQLATSAGPIDTVYLDTTLCHPAWEGVAVPSKQQSITQILELIRAKGEGRDVFISCEMLGTEELMMAVAENFHCSVHVSAKKNKQLRSTPELAEILTTDPHSSRFHFGGRAFAKRQQEQLRCKQAVGGKAQANCKEQREKGAQDAGAPLYIHASTQWFAFCSELRPRQFAERPRLVDNTWYAIFCIHSSMGELEQFLRVLAAAGGPLHVTPITDCDTTTFSTLCTRCHVLPQLHAAQHQQPKRGTRSSSAGVCCLSPHHRAEAAVAGGADAAKPADQRKRRASANEADEADGACKTKVRRTASAGGVICSRGVHSAVSEEDEAEDGEEDVHTRRVLQQAQQKQLFDEVLALLDDPPVCPANQDL